MASKTAGTFHAGRVVAGGAALLALFCVNSFMIVRAADGAVSDGDKACLSCHASEGLEKKLASGEMISLYIPGEAFTKSVHGVIGCSSCHVAIDLKNHPPAKTDIHSAREYSIAMAGTCRQCHEDAFKRYEGSIHASLVRAGNSTAPVCTNCHGAHAVTPRTAYETCVKCHAGATAAHGKWLPNAALHLEVVSCAACHAPGEARMVDLRLYDDATQNWLSEKEGQPRFEKLARSIDPDGNGLDASEVRNLLTEFNRDRVGSPVTLRGRIELRAAAAAHQLSDKASAIRQCDSCHRAGAEPFQTVTISVVGSDGRPLRHSAHKEVLTSALSADSLRLFYAIGGTRNTLLDALLVLTVLVGVSVPIGHQIMKRLISKGRRSKSEKNTSA